VFHSRGMAGRAYITPVAWIQEEKDEEEQEEWSEARVDLSHHSSSNTAAPPSVWSRHSTGWMS